MIQEPKRGQNSFAKLISFHAKFWTDLMTKMFQYCKYQLNVMIPEGWDKCQNLLS